LRITASHFGQQLRAKVLPDAKTVISACSSGISLILAGGYLEELLEYLKKNSPFTSGVRLGD
jgi:hypothetical protein